MGTEQTAAAGPSRYGAPFDALAARWAALEDEHDAVHPKRDECGGVGRCSMMLRAKELEGDMMCELNEWRVQR